MKNRVLRISLVVLALAAQAGAGFFVYQAEQQREAARAAWAALARDIGRAQALVGDLRGAQTGLVAAGQDSSYWVPRVAALSSDAASFIEKAGRSQLAADAARDLAAATAALAEFGRTSDHMRDLLATDQPLAASSLAFGDAAQSLSTTAAALASVVALQAQAIEREAARVRPLEGLALAGVAALTVGVLLLLLPRTGREPAPAADAEAPAAGLGLSLTIPTASELGALGQSGFDLDIDTGPLASASEVPPEPAREPEEAIVANLRGESQLPLNTATQVDLALAARLCGDLARVKDSSELPGILSRSAELLDASGIVLWLIGPEGSVLRPAASVGYSDHTLAKMKALSGQSDNAVAVAFRGREMEVVASRGDRNGAVVVPILTASGCAGALAVEVRHGAETSRSVQAVAAILAAQLATLVADNTAPA
jgi:hypothetical protein